MSLKIARNDTNSMTLNHGIINSYIYGLLVYKNHKISLKNQKVLIYFAVKYIRFILFQI